MRRSVQEAVALIVEDIFAVVGAVDHRCTSVDGPQCADYVGEHAVRIAYGVVVAVYEAFAVGTVGVERIVGREICVLGGITVFVEEVRPIGMEHEELLGMRCVSHGLAKPYGQFIVVGVSLATEFGIAHFVGFIAENWVNDRLAVWLEKK